MRKILPNFAICYFIILMIIFLSIFLIINQIMPQYGLYKEDNNVISRNQVIKRKNFIKEGYPLLNYDLTKFSDDTTKILILGDSYLEGDGYSNINDTWWKKLQLELYSRGYYDVEILAVGQNGVSTYDEYIYLSTTSMIEDIKPDLILIGYVSNDPELDDEDIVLRAESKNYLYNNSITNALSKIYPNIIYKINNMLEEKYNSKGNFNDVTGYPSNLWSLKIIDDYHLKKYNEKAIIPLANILNEYNIPAAVLSTETGTTKKRKELNDRVFNLLKNAGIEIYDIHSYLSDLKMKYPYYKYNEKINPVNSHPGTFYTKFFADYFADILENNYQQILGEKRQYIKDYPININDWLPYEINPKKTLENEDYVEYIISKPKTSNILYMPIHEKYLKLSLEFPVKLSKIEIRNSDNLDVYLTKIDEQKGYDTGHMYKLENNNNTFEINSPDLISTINISGNMDNNFTIRIYKGVENE